MKKTAIYTLAALTVFFVVIQFVPADVGTNPAVETDIGAPPEIDAILRRSCYDCHSFETRWPWYSHVAPSSWLLARDVKEGRHHFNLSTWNQYNSSRRAKIIREMWDEVDQGDMPPWFYLPMHPDARLSDEDKAKLESWSKAASDQAKAKGEVEDAVNNLLNDTHDALKEAAKGIIDTADKIKKAADDAIEKSDDDHKTGTGTTESDGPARIDNRGPGSANSGKGGV